MQRVSASRDLVIKAVSRYALAMLALGLMFFLPAGTLRYWQAWVYLFILFTPMAFVLCYLLRNDPDLLERRLRMQEREATQKRVIEVSLLLFLFAFLLPGFDRRFGWSHVHPAVVIAADIAFLAGYGLFLLVLKENRYAARTIQVEAGQKVIQTGPYAVVRHPMYSATLLMYLSSPLALGSYWAVIPMLAYPVLLAARIRNEERLLLQELEGYREYMAKVRYRLIPKVW